MSEQNVFKAALDKWGDLKKKGGVFIRRRGLDS